MLRIALTYLATKHMYTEYFIKADGADTYRVNINDLFDLDEEFLFEN